MYDVPDLYRAKVSETCAEEVLTQVLSLIEAHFCQKMVPWVVRVIGQSHMYTFTILLVCQVQCMCKS